MALIAKPIVKNQVWIVTNDTGKIGNVISNGTGYTVQIGDKWSFFDSTKSIQKTIPIHFQTTSRSRNTTPYAVWPTTGKTYNNLYDLKRKIHLYTKTTASKCYYAAGWFRMMLNGEWQTVFCPKYIFIQRYEYSGPYSSKEEADKC